MSAHWEVARGKAGWTTRLVANGRVIFSSTKQGYRHRRDALRAIEIAVAWPNVNHGIAGWTDGIGRDIDIIDERPEVEPIPDVTDAAALGAWAYRQPAVKREVDADKKIHAIKELRTLTDCGLREAKEAIETLPGMGRWER